MCLAADGHLVLGLDLNPDEVAALEAGLGLAFKPGTDDLRHSPWLELAAALVRAGFDLRAVDPELDPRHLVGANLRVALEHREIPFERLVPVLDLTRLALEAPIPAVPDRTGSS